MTKHTPGPWFIAKCQCGHEKCSTYWLKNVGTFYQGCGFELADAKLIAAAPTLLSALQIMIRAFESPSKIEPLAAFAALEKATAAVEEATG